MASTTATGAVAPEPPSQRLATEDYVDRKLAELEARIHRAMLIQTGATIAVIVAALKFIPPAY